VIYFDTSCLFRLYFEDPGFTAVRDLAVANHVACAAHGQAEMLAAFHRKLREGAVTPKSYQTLLSQFETDREAGAFHWLPASPEVLERIRTVYARLPRTVYLRGADALHLATAAVHGFKAVHSNDNHLLAAASHFKLKGLKPLAG
jgi:predicted nucleic acid-binding protein